MPFCGERNVWKCYFAFVLLVIHNALAQVSSGTAIIFDFSENETIIAADSLAGNGDTGTPDYSRCKIAAFGHKVIFTTVGNSGWADSKGLTPTWDNMELARDAAHESDVDSVAAKWAKSVKSYWDFINRMDPRRARDIASANAGQFTAGVFVGKGLAARAAIIGYDGRSPDPVTIRLGEITDCWPCAQSSRARICAAGSHIDVAAKFCSERKKTDKIELRTKLRKSDSNSELTVKIVELTIDAYKLSGDVGGAVDAVTIKKNGTIHWNSRKENCPDNKV
jgi:hypothetical protein